VLVTVFNVLVGVENLTGLPPLDSGKCLKHLATGPFWIEALKSRSVAGEPLASSSVALLSACGREACGVTHVPT
jgi:hypothetical protein